MEHHTRRCIEVTPIKRRAFNILRIFIRVYCLNKIIIIFFIIIIFASHLAQIALVHVQLQVKELYIRFAFFLPITSSWKFVVCHNEGKSYNFGKYTSGSDNTVLDHRFYPFEFQLNRVSASCGQAHQVQQ